MRGVKRLVRFPGPNGLAQEMHSQARKASALLSLGVGGGFITAIAGVGIPDDGALRAITECAHPPAAPLRHPAQLPAITRKWVPIVGSPLVYARCIVCV